MNGLIFTVALAVLFVGCSPPGPSALLEGKRLLDQGKYGEAVERLKIATTLLSTNAQAWNYLGLAYHRSGLSANATAAYQRALVLDRNLLEARFNLGCLWLEQNNLDAAKAEFTGYTLRRPNAPEGWIKLGFTQLRSRDIAGAEKSFSEALRFSSQNPDALNGIGLAQLQRNRPREAAQYFAAALKQQPDHRPAMLNLAKVLQANLNDRAGALRYYREYLALKPKSADWDAVNAVADALDQQLAAQQRPQPTNVVTQVLTNAPGPKPQAAVAKTTTPPKTEATKPASTPTVTPQSTAPVEVVTLAPEPVIKTTPDVQSTSAPPPKIESPAEPDTAIAAPTVTQQPQKRGFFSKINPVNLFRRDPKPAPKLTPLPAGDSESQAQTKSNAPLQMSIAVPDTVRTSAPPVKLTAVQRYAYVSPRKPAPGNRGDAESAFAQGNKSREAGNLSDAAQSFSQAVKSDPAWFEAQFALALTQFELKQYKKSLAAWEGALAVRPDSTDARYNFALALKAANYPLDAANELERILAASPEETRAHLALGNLCAEQLRDTARARAHYLKVLELSPSHPQGSSIRYWLVSNPQ